MASKIKLIANPAYKRNGTKSYVHLLRKYGFNPTLEGPYFHASSVVQQGKFVTATGQAIGGRARVHRRLQKKVGDQVGDVPAEDVQNDSLYLAQVGIGTPAQNLKLDFDSGSADLWVWSTELPSNIQSQATGHTIFDPSKSSTFKGSSGETWQISYGDGSSASGDVGTDVLNLGGLVIKNQAIELAENMSSSFVSGPGDGLLGLAFGNINTVKPNPVKTPMENLIAQNEIPQSAQLFTVHLGSSKEANDQSWYTFGYIDEDTVKASGQQITYTPVDKSQGFWQFSSTTATVNGKTINRSGNTAIADTGTTLALVDDQTLQAIYSAIPGATYDSSVQGYIFPSNISPDQLPTVTFAVGDKQFAVHKDALAFAEAKSGYVYGGIQSRGDLTFDILGDTFLKGIYAIFDVGNTRFGAVQKPDPTSSSTSSSS
ncbi:aspartic endopeptidase [Rasamsonia emersonii CBS 393.64]|uniref:Aspartic endopeptidase n=1 Tax=Rasamsonia emersonii (strain ATCC 16479 / CBS 393.64 / IMI 116815) TaxID=1408163 RepID=A0A0F4YU03_RASE3|nr:aspartic endopeptidase [Rasamsonia emersonii CBS 393.64]KKA21600.1 aspartic endopeptidase [Rasamsonia emersonii CBS 393.64]